MVNHNPGKQQKLVIRNWLDSLPQELPHPTLEAFIKRARKFDGPILEGSINKGWTIIPQNACQVLSTFITPYAPGEELKSQVAALLLDELRNSSPKQRGR